MPSIIHIRDPRAKKADALASKSAVEAKQESTGGLPSLSALSGKTLAVLNNGWTAMDSIAEHVIQGLKTRYGIGEVLNISIPLAVAADHSVYDEVVKRADFAVVGLAN